MSTDPQPRELQVKCVMGAVNLPESGYLSGTHARDLVQKDPSNLIPASFYHQADNALKSQRLNSVPQSAGGLIPEVNMQIGAPKATFAYGAINTTEVHPTLNLIKAASVSIANPSIVYILDPSAPVADISQTVGGGTDVPPSPPESYAFPSPQYPFIPSVATAPFSSNTPNLTYNIWQQTINGDQAALNKLLKYTIYYGVTNYLDQNMVHLNTNIDSSGGASITVHAQGQTTVLERLFPIADDLAYTGTSLYYPNVNGTAIPPDKIKAKGGDNCGFWVHFDHSDIPPQTQSDGSRKTGGMIINWGGGGDESTIHNFSLILIPGQIPKLYYLLPKGVPIPTGSNVVASGSDSWIEFSLNGATFGDGEFDVFVHFVGPNMLIGFDSNVNGWNCFSPLSFNQNAKTSSFNKYYEPHIPRNSKINIVFSNVMSTFTYSPICFNNFHPENLANGGKSKIGYVRTNFTVPKTYLGFALENDINTYFQSHRSPPTNFNSNDFLTQPTIYGDWRRKDAELYYVEDANQTTINTADGYPDVVITGNVFYDTTIEGPQFIHIRNFRPDSSPRTPTDVMVPIWDKYSDISSYVVSCHINTSMEGKNSSILQSTAEISLKNMDNTAIGAQIQNAISGSETGITFSAGYDGSINNFFEGIVQNVKVTHTNEGTITTLTCSDIATRVFNDTRFKVLFRFGGRTFQGIITDVIDMSGLGEFFKLRAKLTNGNDDFYTVLERNLAFRSYNEALAQQVLFATTLKFISSVLYPAIELTIGKNVLPALYWDPQAHTLNLDRREELPVDNIYFVGTSTPDNINYLPNNYSTREHGVIFGEWHEETDVSILASELHVYGSAYDGHAINFDADFPYALGTTALASMKNLSTAMDLGYVGRQKSVWHDARNIYGSRSGINDLGADLTQIVRNTYTKVNFEVYATQPFTHMGQFQILTFIGGSDYTTTSTYYYKSVSYDINVNENTIKSKIEGERFPRFISPS